VQKEILGLFDHYKKERRRARRRERKKDQREKRELRRTPKTANVEEGSPGIRWQSVLMSVKSSPFFAWHASP
jgi:hypothetical protein